MNLSNFEYFLLGIISFYTIIIFFIMMIIQSKIDLPIKLLLTSAVLFIPVIGLIISIFFILKNKKSDFLNV